MIQLLPFVLLAATTPTPPSQAPALDHFGIEVSTGLIGVFAPVNVALSSPLIRERLQLGLRASWSMPAASVAHEDDRGERILTYLPWMVTANPFFQLRSRPLAGRFYIYGGGELMVGSTFATQPNLIGDNITIGASAYGGLEVWARRRFAWFISGGVSGVFTLVIRKLGVLDISQHGGSGFFIRTGLRFQLARRACD